MATAEELRQMREQQSIFAALYDLVNQQNAQLAAEGRVPKLGGLLSKEPVEGYDTVRFEGLGGILSAFSPMAKAFDAPMAAAQGNIPREDMLSEALGTAGMAMLGGGAVPLPKGAIGANSVREVVKKYPDVEIDIYGSPERGYELGKIKVPEGQRGSGIGTQVMDEIVAAADAEGARVSLTPDTSFGGSSVSRLKDFYKRFGFVENKGRNKDFSTRNTMYRDPLMANASKPVGLLVLEQQARGNEGLKNLFKGQGIDISDLSTANPAEIQGVLDIAQNRGILDPRSVFNLKRGLLD